MMKTDNSAQNPICVGTGLIALDVIVSADASTPVQLLAGGSCGNVLTILSYLGWNTFPIARLSNNSATSILVEDLDKWNVNCDLLSSSTDGSTPIIIHRILKDDQGVPKHKFEFKNPEDGTYLPSYKPCLAKSVNGIINSVPHPNVFYFDRISRAAIDLAIAYKDAGAIVFFEPSSCKDIEAFKLCLSIADIVKFSNDRISDFDFIFPLGQAPLEIQTIGKDGLMFRRKGCDSWIALPSYSIEGVVDSAGAGDWCSAGLVFNLFKNKTPIIAISDTDIKDALRFGQILSALNCTFEGARGLMYNYHRVELVLAVQHILSLSSSKIPTKQRPKMSFNSSFGNFQTLKISSLL